MGEVPLYQVDKMEVSPRHTLEEVRRMILGPKVDALS